MAEQESARSFEMGVTLVEVMIALLIFSSMIGASGSYLSTTVSRPFVTERVEPWLQFLDQVNRSLRELPAGSPLIGNGIHQNPFPDIVKPAGLKTWQMEWLNNNLDGYGTAHFKATTLHDRSIEWTIHKKTF